MSGLATQGTTQQPIDIYQISQLNFRWRYRMYSRDTRRPTRSAQTFVLQRVGVFSLCKEIRQLSFASGGPVGYTLVLG